MSDLHYNLLKSKVDDLIEETVRLMNSLGGDIDLGAVSDMAPLNIVFAGQYSAGKSTLIKMLTGIEDIKIGAGVTTGDVTEYKYKSLKIWDTPGIKAGECEQHDEKAIAAINKADLLIYVITNELFDDVVGATFRDLCFNQGRAKEIMIVINKFESDSASKETKISGITQVLEPNIPEDFPIVFTDAQSYFDALDEDDEEERQELLELSNHAGFTQAIDNFVVQRGLYSRLTTPLQNLYSSLEKRLDELTINDPLQRGVVSVLSQTKRVFNSNQRDLVKKVQADMNSVNSEIIRLGEQLADALGGEQEEFEKTQEHVVYECKKITEKAFEAFQMTVEECFMDLDKELNDLANTPASIKVRDALDSARNMELKREGYNPETYEKDDPLKLNNIFSQSMLKTAEKGFSFISKSAVGDVTKEGLKRVSGSTLHSAVKELGKFFGYKFKPYEAVKIADKIGSGAKFLGPAMSVFGVGMQIYDDYQQAEHAKKVLQVKRDIRKTFRDCGNSVRMNMEEQLSAIIESGFEQPINTIEQSLSEFRMEAETKSNSTKAAHAQLDEIRKLRKEIQSYV